MMWQLKAQRRVILEILKIVILEKIETDKQKADLFTKGFNEEKFVILRKLLYCW